MNTDPWLVVTTVGSAADARTLARDMVESRFAACAQVSAIDSIYRWQGEVHAGPEWHVLFKTRPDAAPALVAAIRARHPYQLPAIHAIATTLAEPAYAQWVAESVDQQPGGGADTR